MAEETETFGPYKVTPSEDNKLGSGSFGTVFRAVKTDDGTPVAAKRVIPVENSFLWIHTFQVYSKREVDILNKTREAPHHNILKIIHIKDQIDADVFENKKLWIISELCDLGDLNSYMDKFDVQLSNILDIIHQACSGLHHLHSMTPKIIHRDVKASNILLITSEGRHVVRLCDFGIAREMDGSELTEGLRVGTHTYRAPELFADSQNYTEMVDVFALGITLLQMIMSDPASLVKLEKTLDKLIINHKDQNEHKTWTSIGQIMNKSRKEFQVMDVKIPFLESSNPLIKTKSLISRMICLLSRERIDIKEIQLEIERIHTVLPPIQIPIRRGEVLALTTSNAGSGAEESTLKTVSAAHVDSNLDLDESIMSTLSISCAKPKSSVHASNDSDIPATDKVPSPFTPPTADDITVSQRESQTLVPVPALSIATAMPRIERKFVHQLPFAVSVFAAYHPECMVLEELYAPHRLVKLSLSATGYTTPWPAPKQRPEGVEEDSRKYLLPDQRVVFRKGWEDPTLVFSPDLEGEPLSFSGNYGKLVGTVDPDMLVYANNMRVNIYKVDGHKHVTTLSQSIGIYTSISQQPTSGSLAVVGHFRKTLDIYSGDFTHQTRVRLPFSPIWHNSVAAVKEYIVICEEYKGRLYVYSWGGEKVGEVEVGGMVEGIGRGGQDTLQVQVGADKMYVFSVE